MAFEVKFKIEPLPDDDGCMPRSDKEFMSELKDMLNDLDLTLTGPTEVSAIEIYKIESE